MIARIEAGLKLPWKPEAYLAAVAPVDAGPIREILLAEELISEAAEDAAAVAGPEIVQVLCDRYLTAYDGYEKRSERTEAAFRPVRELMDVLERTRPSVFFAIVSKYRRGANDNEIVRLCRLIVRHGSDPNLSLLSLPGTLHTQVVKTLNDWAAALLRSTSATRGHLSDLARAMRRLPHPSQAPLLSKMLQEDLRRYRHERAAFAANPNDRAVLQEMRISHNWDYRDALAKVGSSEAAAILQSQLLDEFFGRRGRRAADDLGKIAHPREE